MNNRIKSVIAIFVFASMLSVSIAISGTPTPHLISLQGVVTDSSGAPLTTGDLNVTIYDAETGGNEIWNSGTLTGVIDDGIFDVLLGSQTLLELDNTQKYWMEIDVNGEEVVGDATSGRQGFWPGGGRHLNATEILDAIKTVDGSGSGLDADLLDGLDSTAFATTLDCSDMPIASGMAQAVAICSSGYTVTGGGCIAPGALMEYSLPCVNVSEKCPNQTGWICKVSYDNVTVWAQAVCCKLA